MKILSILFISFLGITAASANSYIYKALERIPKPEEVIAFTNGKPPPVGQRIFVPKEVIMSFLAHGSPLKDRKKWVRSGPSLSEFRDGVFFDSTGRAYFWSIRMEGVLLLETESGESIQIIKKDGEA